METNNIRNETKWEMMKTACFGIAFGFCLLGCLLPAAAILPNAIVANNDYEEATRVVVGKTFLLIKYERKRDPVHTMPKIIPNTASHKPMKPPPVNKFKGPPATKWVPRKQFSMTQIIRPELRKQVKIGHCVRPWIVGNENPSGKRKRISRGDAPRNTRPPRYYHSNNNDNGVQGTECGSPIYLSLTEPRTGGAGVRTGHFLQNKT
eukprot:scaffold593_cov126-Cylindrotheca_fusiformis.AAC.7